MATITLARDIGGTTQQPAGMHTVGLAQAGDSLLPHDFYDTEVQPVQAGNRYCIAAWVGTASCRAYLFISFHDAAGGFLGGVLSAVIPDGVPGGTDLSSWTRAFVFGTAPAGAATLRFNVRQIPTLGATTALTRLLRPTIEQALPGQTQPSMWAESANGMRAAFREATDAIADDVHAQSTAIQQLSARLDNGGDVHNALVQVTALAESTASAASGSWGVVVDADGKLAGIKALSDGRTSQIVMSADQVLIDGTLTARKIAAGAISTDKLQAGAVSADKIAVTSLSAISAALGAITSAAIELVSSGWSYIRTYSKWFADGVDGFITAARHDTGDYFHEFRATSGSGLILEQKSNGPNVGWRYYMQVRDANGIDRMLIDPVNGVFKFRGQIIAESGLFSGVLSAAYGTLGVITSGYLRNDGDTCSFDLNATGSSSLLRAGNKTLITADGRTRFNNVIYDQTIGVNFSPVKLVAAPDGTGIRSSYINGSSFNFDVSVQLTPDQLRNSTYSARFTGWAGTWANPDFRVYANVSVMQVIASPGEMWTGCRLRLIGNVYLTNYNNDTVPDDSWMRETGSKVTLTSLSFVIAAIS